MLTEASTGVPVAAHVTGNGELATAPPPAFNWGRLNWFDPASVQVLLVPFVLARGPGKRPA
eukprot:3330452-Prymnesium_polylepis.1